jgi:hypothetical protein
MKALILGHEGWPPPHLGHQPKQDTMIENCRWPTLHNCKTRIKLVSELSSIKTVWHYSIAKLKFLHITNSHPTTMMQHNPQCLQFIIKCSYSCARMFSRFVAKSNTLFRCLHSTDGVEDNCSLWHNQSQKWHQWIDLHETKNSLMSGMKKKKSDVVWQLRLLVSPTFRATSFFQLSLFFEWPIKGSCDCRMMLTCNWFPCSHATEQERFCKRGTNINTSIQSHFFLPGSSSLLLSACPKIHETLTSMGVEFSSTYRNHKYDADYVTLVDWLRIVAEMIIDMAKRNSTSSTSTYKRQYHSYKP